MPERAAGTVLAFDFGLRRIGVAVGEPGLGTAHALPPIVAQSGAGRLTAVARLVREWSPARLVVGRPLGEDGRPHEMTRRAERFARSLGERFALPVELVDERYSTVEAESRVRAAYGARKAAQLARGKALDSAAAQIVLEQYLGEHPA
jgi:putative Holliday junction resolvase